MCHYCSVFSISGNCNTIFIDINAAGYGWFIDPTPWDDFEFTTPGDQGERDYIDALSVIAHELGHVLGLDHDDHGVMLSTLATGEGYMPADTEVWETLPNPWADDEFDMAHNQRVPLKTH